MLYIPKYRMYFDEILFLATLSTYSEVNLRAFHFSIKLRLNKAEDERTDLMFV